MDPSEYERDNMVVWNGGPRFFEVYSLKFIHMETRSGFWLKYSIASPRPDRGRPFAELLAVVFDGSDPSENRVFRKVLSEETIKINRDRFILQLGETVITNASAGGEIDTETGAIAWELNFIPNHKTSEDQHRHSMYRTIIPGSKFLSPNVDIYVNGTVRVNGKEFSCQGEPGHQSHRWGTKQPDSFIWGHSNVFDEDETAVFEALSGIGQLGKGLRSPLPTCYIRYRGKDHHFDSTGRFQLIPRDDRTGEWSFKAKEKELRFNGSIAASLEQGVCLAYRNTHDDPFQKR